VFTLEGAFVSLIIGYFATRFGGEGIVYGEIPVI